MSAMTPISEANEHLNSMTLQTGVRWLASLRSNPPTRLRDVKTYKLTDWMIAVLATCAPRTTCWRSLEVQSNHANHIQQLISRVGRGGLRNITYLQVVFWSEPNICGLLALTPSLQELRLWAGWWGDNTAKCKLRHHLPALTTLIIDDSDGVIRPEWIESVRRRAHDELQIITHLRLR